MKTFFFRIVLLVFFFINAKAALINAKAAFGQTAGITSGAIYTLKSKVSNKLLNVSNASIENSANVDSWTNTGSDAQRWILLKEPPQDAAPTNMIAEKVFAAWYKGYNIESVKGFFWDNAEIFILDSVMLISSNKLFQKCFKYGNAF